jgi:Peptidase family S41/N-terminal domain of Peptidase_S41 in eukaryotic IRBP
MARFTFDARRAVLVFCLGLMAVSRGLAAQQPDTSQTPTAGASLPDSPALQVANDFFAAVDAGTVAAVEAFETAHGSTARRSAMDMAERARRFQTLKEEWQSVRIVELLSQSATTLELRVAAAPGELVFMFDWSAEEPGKLDAIRIMPGAMYAAPAKIDAKSRRELVEGACRALEEGYVYPEVAAQMAKLARANLAQGTYDPLADESALATRLTADFRSVSKDRHLGIMVLPPPEVPAAGHNHGSPAEDNYGFRKVEVLDGNIGYIRLDGFVEAPEAEARATASMNFVRDCDALVFDLRHNGGGSPHMIRYLTSYLFPSRTHLNDMVDRDGEVVEEFWTLDTVPGGALRPDVPVYVLTSSYTFSGAEEFSYNLKNLKRATLVGETTGGGAHPVRGERLNERVVIRIPFMRARNPVSQTNWEGTGVEPDLECPADEALDRASSVFRSKGRGGGPG